MLFGVSLNGPSSKITLQPDPGLHVTNIAYEPTNPGDDNKEKATLFMMREEDKEIMICTLDQKKSHHFLDLQFDETDKMSFMVRGEGTIHITGYYEAEDEGSEDESNASSKS